MPITIVTRMPRGVGPGVSKRASKPMTKPISRMLRNVIMMVPSNFERRQHRHVIGGKLPVAQVDVDMVAPDGGGKRRRGKDMVQSSAAVGLAPVAVAVAPPGI